MRAKDYRHQAWNAMSGKWGTAALIALVYLAIGSVAGFICAGPLELGMAIMASNIVSEKDIEVGQLFKGFDRFGDSFILWITNYIFICLWSCLFIIPGIIKSYSYSMSYYVLNDNPNLSPSEARKRSIELMKGNKWRLFCLHFSFIGWDLLVALTGGILAFWVIPYEQAAVAAFYRSLLPVEEAQIPTEQPAQA